MNYQQFLRKLRVYAHEKGLKFEAVKNRGKGGHQMIHLGDRKTTIPAPNKEVKRGTLHAILRQLGVGDDFEI
jgi:predicted RNA binding protein YcfA (HicA-like mRNA interferase family)